jgi:hypothetical protein
LSGGLGPDKIVDHQTSSPTKSSTAITLNGGIGNDLIEAHNRRDFIYGGLGDDVCRVPTLSKAWAAGHLHSCEIVRLIPT